MQAYPRTRLIGEVRGVDFEGWILAFITLVLTFGCIIAVYVNQNTRGVLVGGLIVIAWARILTFRTREFLEFYLSFEMTLLPILIIVLG